MRPGIRELHEPGVVRDRLPPVLRGPAPPRRQLAVECVHPRVVDRAIAIAIADRGAHGVPQRLSGGAECDIAHGLRLEMPGQVVAVRGWPRRSTEVLGGDHVDNLVAQRGAPQPPLDLGS